MNNNVTISYLDVRPLWNDRKSFQLALKLLPENVQKRITKLRFIDDAKMSLASHILQRYIIWKFIRETNSNKVTSLKDIEFHSGPFGRPYYRSDAECDYIIDFNISTVSGRVIIASIRRGRWDKGSGQMEQTRDYPVIGIDLTDPPSLQSDEWLNDFAPMVSTNDEHIAIKAAADIDTGTKTIDSSLFSAISLAIRWAIKEAYIKGLGTGLVGSIDISTVEIDRESNKNIDQTVIMEYLEQANRAASANVDTDTNKTPTPPKFFPIDKLYVSSIEQPDWRVKLFTFNGIISAITLHNDICLPDEPELHLSSISFKAILNELAA